MLKMRNVVLGAAVAAMFGIVGAANAALVVGPPVSQSATSEFGGPFVAASMFDGTVTDADLDVTSYGAGDNQWAGVGPGPHTLFMDYGSTISANGIAYAQRQGDAVGRNDKVSVIELWFSNTDFGGVVPGGPADATVTVGEIDPDDFGNGLLETFELGGTFNGRYVAARFNVLDGTIDPGLNNIGGSEFRLLVPEPASIALLGLGGLMMLRRRQK